MPYRDTDKVIHVTAHLSCDAAHAFEMFVSSRRLESWLTEKAEVEPSAGGKYELFWDPSNREENSTRGCRVTALVPDQLLAFEWRSPKQFEHFANHADPLTHVVVAFVPTVNGTDVHLVHSGWRSTAKWEAARQWQLQAWSDAFEVLESRTRPEGRFPDLYRLLQGYFYPSWRERSPTEAEVLRRFASHRGPDDARAVIDQIDAALREHADLRALGALVTEYLACDGAPYPELDRHEALLRIRAELLRLVAEVVAGMSVAARFPDLDSFMHCYFHEDWVDFVPEDEEAPTEWTVTVFADRNSVDYVRAVISQIDALLSEYPDPRRLDLVVAYDDDGFDWSAWPYCPQLDPDEGLRRARQQLAKLLEEGRVGRRRGPAD